MLVGTRGTFSLNRIRLPLGSLFSGPDMSIAKHSVCHRCISTYCIALLCLWNNRELENNILPRQAPVHRRKRVQLIFQRRCILEVQEAEWRSVRPGPRIDIIQCLHFQQFGAIGGHTSPLSNNLSGVNEIFQDLLMHIRKGAASRSLLLDTRRTGWFAQHPTLSDEDNMSV